MLIYIANDEKKTGFSLEYFWKVDTVGGFFIVLYDSLNSHWQLSSYIFTTTST